MNYNIVIYVIYNIIIKYKLTNIMDDEGDSEINLYNFKNSMIIVKAKLGDGYNFIKSKITKTNNVIGVRNNNRTTITKRYHLINNLYKFMIKMGSLNGFIDYMINKVDDNFNLVQINRTIGGIDYKFIIRNDDTIKSLIQTLKTNEMINNSMCIDDVLEDEIYSIEDDEIIITKAEIRRINNDGFNELVICIKQFITEYNDPLENYDNTIKNILLFNDVIIDYNYNYILELHYFENFKISKKTFNMNEIYDLHINRIQTLVSS